MAEDGHETIALSPELRPDLIIMDASMPGMDGMEATREIRAEFPQTSVLILTAHTDHRLPMNAVKAGAAGYIIKGERPDDILHAVKAVIKGETPLDQGLARQLLGCLGKDATAQTSPPRTRRIAPESVTASLPNPLTPRETEVLMCLTMGRTNRQIARDLHLSPSTVKGTWSAPSPS